MESAEIELGGHQGTMAYIGDSQGAAEIDPNAFFKLSGPNEG